MVCGRSLDGLCRGLPFFISLSVLLIFICSMIQGVGDRKGRRNMRTEKRFVHFYQGSPQVHSTGAFFTSNYMNISLRGKKK